MNPKPYLSLGEAIEAFLDKHGLRDEARIQQLITEWETVIGKPIAEQTARLWFDRGVLHIHMRSPAWRQELLLARTRIADVVNRYLKTPLVTEVQIH
ncbi:MAG: DUF721 domain-containing protein [Bacteroidia bacterium]|jgi:predicted nucleic acid-binding Zn ribbon protein|nr:DUF721 domain-containing protein [Bacteroidia bacterium]